jgi:integrase
MAVYPKGRQFQANFMVKGRRYRKEFPSQVEAEAWELEVRAAVKLGKALPDSTLPKSVGGVDAGTLGAVFRSADRLHWSRLNSGKNKSPICAGIFVRWAGPKMMPSEAFAQAKIDAFFEYLIVTRKCSNSTLNHYRSALSVLMRYAGLKEEPTLPWYKPGQGRKRFFTDDEEALILQTWSLWGLQRERDFFVFLLDTGARPWSEGASLPWTYVYDTHKVHFAETKNGLPRTLPLTSRAWQAIQGQSRDLPGPWHGLDVFAMNTLWDKTQQKFPQLSDAVIYSCRHTCASRLVQRGWDIRKVKEWMGHKAIVTTMGYAHLAPEHLIEGAEILEGKRAVMLTAIEGGR